MNKKITWPLPGLDLMHEYGLKKPVLVSKGSCVFKLSEDDKDYALKQLDYSWKKLAAFHHAMEFLTRTRFNSYPRLIRGASGHFFVRGKDTSYTLSAWQEGRKADYQDYDDLICCAKTLGQLHKQTTGYLPVGNDWGKHWHIGLSEYQQLLSYSDKYPEEFKQLLSLVIEAGEKASALLQDTKVYARLGQPTVLCHDNLSTETFLISPNQECFLVDFTSARADFPQVDLAQLLRNVLHKRCKDKQNLALKVIAAYCHENPLTHGDLGILLAFLYFPRAIWGQGMDIYNKNPKKQAKITRFIKEVSALQKPVTLLAKNLGFK